MDRVGGSLGSYGDRCAACGRESLHRVLAVHLVDPHDDRDPVSSRVLPSCGPDCDPSVAARAVRPRRGDEVTVVRWRRDGSDWRPDDSDAAGAVDRAGAVEAAEPADPALRARLAAGHRWFHPVRCGHRPRHLALVLEGTASGVSWTRWSCPAEEPTHTPASDARLVDVVEHPVAAWNPRLLRYDRDAVRAALHPGSGGPRPR